MTRLESQQSDRCRCCGATSEERRPECASWQRDAALNGRRAADAAIRVVEAQRDGLALAIEQAMMMLGPGDDEDSDSPANMAFAVLGHALQQFGLEDDQLAPTIDLSTHGAAGESSSVHTCHAECPCHTGGKPRPDFIKAEGSLLPGLLAGKTGKGRQDG